MSSSASRDWSLELRPPWAAIVLLLGWLLLLVLTVGQSAVPIGGWLASVLAVLLLGVPAVCSQLAGLLPAALHHIRWLADGQWLLRDGKGREWAAELLPQSRMLPYCALLLWKHEGGCGWALVQAGRHNRSQYRQLGMRLRWERPDATPDRKAGPDLPAPVAGAC